MAMWHVVGGYGDGIFVREGCSLGSERYNQKLGTFAQIWEEEVRDGRLRYTKLAGDGPKSGWVTINKRILTDADPSTSDCDWTLQRTEDGEWTKPLCIRAEQTSRGRWHRIDFSKCRNTQAIKQVTMDDVLAARLDVDDSDDEANTVVDPALAYGGGMGIAGLVQMSSSRKHSATASECPDVVSLMTPPGSPTQADAQMYIQMTPPVSPAQKRKSLSDLYSVHKTKSPVVQQGNRKSLSDWYCEDLSPEVIDDSEADLEVWPQSPPRRVSKGGA
eukprot:TRINITY_DN60107_c0_g1_i1.p1 TRINITY_DN60107_c0_g1~~TRINITY_DN60107_c0_g1_i1.p1  ORF type:complete len:274 (-),score=54.20 TRINITY_DN60107_c0_g1_i1:100-921(-)